MASQDKVIEKATMVSEEELRALLGAYYDEFTSALVAWGVPRQLEEPAKRIFGIARQRVRPGEVGAVEAWGLKQWTLVGNRTPAELLREPGGALLILRAFGGGLNRSR